MLVFPEKDGDSDIKALYLAVGYAAMQWEHLETRLAILFAVITKMDHFLSLAAYGTPTQHRTRVDMIERSAKVRFINDDNLFEFIRTNLKEVSKVAPLRNRIIHGQITHASFQNEQDDVQEGYYLTSPTYTISRKTGFISSEYFYNSLEIIGIANDFEEKREKVNKVIDMVEAANNAETD